MTKTLSLFFLLMLAAAPHLAAQTTYTSAEASVNVGEPERVLFFFDVPNAPGDTVLSVQCDYQRAWLITNYAVYGKQQTSGFFPITCTPTGFKSYVLNGTPLPVNLVLTGYGNSTNVALTVNSANWQLAPCKTSRWGCSAGSAQIAY